MLQYILGSGHYETRSARSANVSRGPCGDDGGASVRRHARGACLNQGGKSLYTMYISRTYRHLVDRPPPVPWYTLIYDTGDFWT